MSSLDPLVSVLMPVWNGARYLAASLDSLLAQTYHAFEVIVVDDGSTDETPAILRAYASRDARIRLVRSTDCGLSPALNAGLQLASGALIARQDADDLSEPDRLQRQVHAMVDRPTLALLGTQATLINADGMVIGRTHKPLTERGIRWYAQVDNPFIHSSVMARTAVLRAMGGYLRRFDPIAADYHFWRDILAAGYPCRNLPACLVRYRVHDASLTGRLATRRTFSSRLTRHLFFQLLRGLDM